MPIMISGRCSVMKVKKICDLELFPNDWALTKK